MLEAERARREKIEEIAARGGSAGDKLREIETQLGELAKRNDELEKALTEETAKTEAAVEQRTKKLEMQLSMMKTDNVMLAEKLARTTSPGGSLAETQAEPTKSPDREAAQLLAETKSSLASALAERNEYRSLLQRERLDGAGHASAPTSDAHSAGLNAKIGALETERVDLIRQLEHERSRNEQIAAGLEKPRPAGTSQQTRSTRLAELEDQKAKLERQLDVAQQDVLNARTAGGAVDQSDVAALLSENKQLQAELEASARSGKVRDAAAMETEISALRAQNSVLSQEISKRIAEAPTVAAADNAAAAANYRARVSYADSENLALRFDAVEAENMRLARELAKTRKVPTPFKAPQTHDVALIDGPADSVRMASLDGSPQSVVPAVPKAQSPKPVMQPIVDAGEMAGVPDQPAMMQAAYQAPPAIAPSPPSPMFTAASPPADAGPSGRDIESFLRRSGVNLASGIEKVRKVSNGTFSAFRWDTGVVYGTAEQRVMTNRKGFRQAIDDYLDKTESRCSGAFDTSFDLSKMSRDETYAVADVACVMPDGQGAGAAIVFFYRDGVFTAVAHEGEIRQFEQAMQARDLLARFLSSVI